MGTVNLTLPSDGTTGEVADVNSPLTALATEINGNLDNTNVKANAGIDPSKIATGYPMNKLTNPYKFSVYRNAAWTSTGSAYGKVSFDTENYDTGSNYDNVTNFRFTAPAAGFYQFNAAVKSNTAAGALVGIAFYKNGVIERSVEIENGANTTPIGPSISALLQLAANDYIEVFHYGSASAGSVGKHATYFDGYLVTTT